METPCNMSMVIDSRDKLSRVNFYREIRESKSHAKKVGLQYGLVHGLESFDRYWA